MSLQLQVGIHSGSAIAGIIGHKRFQYDLCGDAVNTAARMCAYSAPGCITISDTTQSLLGDEYATLSRGVREIKGKGSMHLHYLLARTNPYLKAAGDAPHSSSARGGGGLIMKLFPAPPGGRASEGAASLRAAPARDARESGAAADAVPAKEARRRPNQAPVQASGAGGGGGAASFADARGWRELEGERGQPCERLAAPPPPGGACDGLLSG